MFYFIFFPALGAAIGWITNFLAIKYLFRPLNPWGWGRFKIQGVLPRRRQELATAVGQVVERELLTRDQIAAALHAPEVRTSMAQMAGKAAGRRVVAHPMLFAIPQVLRHKISEFVVRVVEKEVNNVLAGGGPELATQVLSGIDLGALVEDKLVDMEWEHIERIVYSVAGRELRLVEYMGGILGAFVGLIQTLVVTML